MIRRDLAAALLAVCVLSLSTVIAAPGCRTLRQPSESPTTFGVHAREQFVLNQRRPLVYQRDGSPRE